MQPEAATETTRPPLWKRRCGRSDSMQIGVVYPQTELQGDPDAEPAVRDQHVEDLGFGHLLAYDHVLGAVHADRTRKLTGPYTERDPFHDPFVLFDPPRRDHRTTPVRHWGPDPPAATDRPRGPTSDRRRSRLGWSTAARCGSWAGATSSTRPSARTSGPAVSRQEEQIHLLRQLFTEPVVDFSGRFDRIDRAALDPEAPHGAFPIWLGGSGDIALDRAARLRGRLHFHRQRRRRHRREVEPAA